MKGAPIHADGTLGSWFDPPQLITPRATNAAVLARGRIYAIGGLASGGAPLTSVEVADVLPNGSLSTWRTTRPLPGPLFTHVATTIER